MIPCIFVLNQMHENQWVAKFNDYLMFILGELTGYGK